MIKFVFVNPEEELTDNYIDSFLETLERESIIANCQIYKNDEENYYEVYLKTSSDKMYFLFLKISTYDGSKHFDITIEPQVIDNNKFDNDLYNIKLKIKNMIRDNWRECFWLEDRQSTKLSEELYGKIYRVENLLRQFINMVMTRTFGLKWWEKFIPFELKSKYKSRYTAYKRIAPSFTNINDNLLSIDTSDLIEIITYEYQKWEPSYTEEIESLLRKKDIQKDANKIATRLKEQLVTKIDFWEMYFEQYLDEDFLNKWNEFSKNRNHVAHNKLLDLDAYKVINNNIEFLLNKINEAKNIFENTSLSDEELEKQQEILEDVYREQHKNEYMNMIYEETGTEVYDQNQIFNMFKKPVSELVESIGDEFYFRPDLHIEENEFKKQNEQILLIIQSEIENENIKVKSLQNINGFKGGTSELVLEVFINDKKQALKYVSSIVNGDIEYNEEEGIYMPLKSSEINIKDIELFLSELNDLIENTFPNLKEEADNHHYSVIKDGASPVVADIPCFTCGQSYISIDEEFYEVGICVNWGQSHNIKKCLRCEQYFYGEGEFCDYCNDKIENE